MKKLFISKECVKFIKLIDSIKMKIMKIRFMNEIYEVSNRLDRVQELFVYSSFDPVGKLSDIGEQMWIEIYFCWQNSF